MTFSTRTDTIQTAGGGQIASNSRLIYTYDNFATDVKVGRFASVDGGKLVNYDKTKFNAGVVVRNAASAIEAGSEVGSIATSVDTMAFGVITCDIDDSAVPVHGGRVYITDDGLATHDSSSTTPADAIFWQEESGSAWQVYVGYPQAGSVAAHIANSINAHASGSITYGAGSVEDGLDALVATVTYEDYTDPADAGTLTSIETSGFCGLTVAGTETRTIDVPETLGVELVVGVSAYTGGAVTVTYNTSTTVVLKSANDFVTLKAVANGAVLEWLATSKHLTA